MKILFFSDVHFKYFSSISVFNSQSEKGLTKELDRAKKSMEFVRDKILEIKPDLVVFLGDYFHNLNVNQNIVISVGYNSWKEIERICKELNIELIAVQGNHDLISNYYSMIDLFNGIKQPQILSDYKIGIVPYFEPFDDFLLSFMKMMNSDIDLVLTHIDIIGFNYNRKKIVDRGVDLSEFDKDSKIVISGHIHLPQQNGNTYYVGSLYPNNYSELGDIKQGILIYDDGNIYRISNNYIGDLIEVRLSQYLNGFVEISSEKIDCIKIIVDEDLSSNELQEIKSEISSKFNSPVIFQNVRKEKEIKKVKVSDIIVEPKEIIKQYIDSNYSDLSDLVKEVVR